MFVRCFAAKLAALVVLTACSTAGGGNQGQDPDPDPTEDPTGLFASYISRQDAIVPEYAGLLPDDSLPAGGSVDYDGVLTLIAFGGTSEFELRGAMTMNVDFDDNSVSGEAVDVVDADDRLHAGTITVVNGSVDTAGADPNLAGNPGLTGDLVGQLDSPDLGELVYDIPFVATVYDDATYLNGNGVTLESTITVDGVEDGLVATSFVLEAAE